MDILIDLIVWLVRALVGANNKPTQTPLPSSRPGTQAPAARSHPAAQAPVRHTQTHSGPMVPTTSAPVQSPVDDGETWRNVLTVLALVLLFILVAVWFVYMQGSLTGG